ncbi:hypothetical protein B0H17DRAFT_1196280 [Mycena rosella]|uniref:Uncharacterized protein n=1 Tax=Mycena rosella TaxID=1033263 RepID=A0AAD7DUJ5_MYCRO|nr:hypothetical protein B0H17DRAFT_1196280 [Mycena rosella]
MPDTSLNMATLMASWLAAVLYGMNVVLYICCVRVLYRRGLVGINRILLVLATLQFLISTGHNVTCVVQLIRGFITNGGTSSGPFIYFLDMASTEHVLQESFYIANSVIGDGILIWRMFIVWNRNWWLCGPFLALLTATTICGYIAVSHLARFAPLDPVFLAALGQWILSTWSLSLVTQVGATLLIAYRIWVNTAWNMKTGSSHANVFWMVVESGAVYSFTTVILLALYVSKLNSGAIVGGALGQLSCLIPTSIIVRIGFTTSSGSTAGTYPSLRAVRPAHPSSQGTGTTKYGEDNAFVTVTRRTETESGQDITLTHMPYESAENKHQGLGDLETGI